MDIMNPVLHPYAQQYQPPHPPMFQAIQAAVVPLEQTSGGPQGLMEEEQEHEYNLQMQNQMKKDEIETKRKEAAQLVLDDQDKARKMAEDALQKQREVLKKIENQNNDREFRKGEEARKTRENELKKKSIKKEQDDKKELVDENLTKNLNKQRFLKNQLEKTKSIQNKNK